MARIDAYISDGVKSKAKFFALQHQVSMSTLIEDALVQLISHHELIFDNSVNYEYFTFDYPDGGFKNNNTVPFFELGEENELQSKLIEEFYGGSEND